MLESFQLFLKAKFLIDCPNLSQNNVCSEVNSFSKMKAGKEKFSDNPLLNNLEFYKVLIGVLFTTRKAEHDMYYKLYMRVASGVAERIKPSKEIRKY